MYACSVSNISIVSWQHFSLYSVCISSGVQQLRMNENAKTCTKYLSGLITLAAGQSEATAGNVRDLIQALVVSTYKTCLLRIRALTIQSLSVHYRYRNQPIRIDTVIMLYRYVWYTSSIILHLALKTLSILSFQDLNYVEREYFVNKTMVHTTQVIILL